MTNLSNGNQFNVKRRNIHTVNVCIIISAYFLKMSLAPAIGIDLGTTFSSAAVYRNGKTEVIPDKEGKRLTPSFVFYNPHNLNVSVGTTADDKSVKNIENFLFDIKRIIGRKYDDVYIQQLKESPEYKFKIVRGGNDMAAIELYHNNVIVRKTPEEVSSEILKYLRESASEYLGTDITEAVISIPAHFSNAQRKATRAAAELAGLKVLKLITEPVAAAIHYAEDKLETSGTLLVFDFGGGTLDVSIIEVDQKAFKVKSVEGDSFLGGRDFDQILLNQHEVEIISKFGFGIFTDRLLRRVKKACIKLKIKLSTQEEYSLTTPCIGGDEDSEYILELSRSEFEDLTKSICIRAMNCVTKCLYEAGLSRADINAVILVGGTTRIPKIRSMLSSYFENKKIKTDLNPDEAVALGAAVQAAMIKEKFKDLEKYSITEVTPLSLGIGRTMGLMKVFIKKNTPLPFKSPPFTGRTKCNNQKNGIFNIFEGERKMCKFNNLLGSFKITDLPPGKAGTVKCESIFSLDEDGILEVEAYEITTKKKNKLVVTLGEYRLCENKIKNIIEDAEKNKEDDDLFETFTYLADDIRQKCNHILYDVSNIPSEINRELAAKRCQEMKRFSETIDYTQIDDLRKEYTCFQKVVKGIIQNYINVELDINTESTQTDSDVNTTLTSKMESTNLSDLLPRYDEIDRTIDCTNNLWMPE